MGAVIMVISARERDLGGFTVRRILPYASHCMVGPFIFFDHMGPARFAKGKGLDVRPHPHIHLATVTYLFEGQILHQDSLGSKQLIDPGDINWMTAGCGIVHSERTPEALRKQETSLDGIQCWVALPKEYEKIQPSFSHYAKESLPSFEINGIRLKLLLGRVFDQESPVPVLSDLFYLEAIMPKDSQLVLPTVSKEAAVYVVEGRVQILDKEIAHCEMAVSLSADEISIRAKEASRVMLLGGKPLGERFIYWNFVSSTEENIEKAKQDWANGPGDAMSRFPKIPSDQEDYIPLPEDEAKKNPKGTIM